LKEIPWGKEIQIYHWGRLRKEPMALTFAVMRAAQQRAEEKEAHLKRKHR